ncbi:hypothetical protein CDD81_1643 [Ophiocordyceps australis]|uniref:Cyclin-like F-box n=1 Tax=Ophiocordyceps australis TaxID=1399860 RepID=A0A2C5XF97_9HYPO|nr:hypothetical protein CDD81_1643 [Ophiocordyceps australis]
MFKLLLVLAILCITLAQAVPQRNGNGNNGNGNNGNGRGRGQGRGGGGRGGGGRGGGNKQTAQQKAAKVKGGISQSDDGTMILDQTVKINGLDIRYRVSAPAEAFTQDSGVQGAQAQPNTDGDLGMNVLLHGDGGQSFFAYPNKGVNDNLMGVAVLSPDPNLKWGGADRNGQERPDGEAHSDAVASLIANELPKMVAFNQSNVWFTGVSGGSLTLSGFFMPKYMGTFGNTGFMLTCGGMAPQLDFTSDASAALANTRIHFQSTTQELKSLQKEIPQSIQGFEAAAQDAGLNKQQINALQTTNNEPNGGHCEFDEQGFDSGVQLMADNFASVMFGNGQVQGIGNVANGVVGAENLKFAKGGR